MNPAKIPVGFPFKKLRNGGRRERTCRKMSDTGGKGGFYFHELEGGTGYTVGCCIEDRQPYRLIDAARYSPEDAATLMVSFVYDHDVETLNLAGPRESEWAGGYAYAFRAVDVFVSRLRASG